MTGTETASRWRELAAWLREELAPRPGRIAACARTTVGCTITVVVAMVFEIPLPAYSALIVLFLSREEYVGTLISAVGGAIAATVGVVLSLLFFMVDASEPALRIPLMAVSTFVGMFLVRTSALGPIAFLAGFVLVVSQTLIDAIPSTEALTRLVLWLWVVVVFPATLTALIDLAFGRNPGRVALQTGLRLLDSVTAELLGRPSADADDRQAEALELLEGLQHAQMADRGRCAERFGQTDSAGRRRLEQPGARALRAQDHDRRHGVVLHLHHARLAQHPDRGGDLLLRRAGQPRRNHAQADLAHRRRTDRWRGGPSQHRLCASANDGHRPARSIDCRHVGGQRLGHHQQRALVLSRRANGLPVLPRRVARLRADDGADDGARPHRRHPSRQCADDDRVQHDVAGQRARPGAAAPGTGACRTRRIGS